MADFIKIDADRVNIEVNSLLAQYLELAEDDELLQDMLTGSTSFMEIIQRLVSARLDASAMADAIKARESDLKARRGRYERQEEAMNSLILSLMQTAQQAKVTLPDATVSITKPRQSVNVIDIDALEQPYVRFKREADKKAIAFAIESGIVVNGAELVMGEPSISIRTK